MVLLRLVLSLAVLMPLGAMAQTAAPPDARVYIISPRNGQWVKSPVTVQFGLSGMGVTRAGDTAPNVGHHHLLLDVDAKDLPANEPIPTDRKHLHFGGGQTEVKLDVPNGEHTLQLVLGDAEHKIFNPPVISEKITINVGTPPVAKRGKRSKSAARNR